MSNVVFELFAKLGLDSSDYEKGLDNAKSKATSAGSLIGNGLKTIGKVGAAALGAATTAVGAFATSSVKTGAEFDKSMSQVAATMGKTMDEMQNEVGSVDLAWGNFSGNLREYAQEMGRNTAFSATQAADALNYMALAGYDTQTSMEMLPNVLNLAAAGNMDLARASDMVTDTQTAFGVSLDRTSQMVDEMAKAASTGNTSVEQLGDAFLVVGGLAQEMNGGMVQLSDGTTATYDNVQELEIALTAMANAGIKGSEAGTHMRNMLLKLASPTEDGYKAFTQLGVSVFDSEGKMRSLAGIMEDLDGSLANLTQEEKLQAISDIFNTRDTAAAEALLNAVGQDWGNIAESILDADGAAQQMAATQLDNLAGDVTLFQSALEGAKIAVSDQLTPSLREFVQFGTDGLSTLTGAFKEGGLSGAMEAFGTILSDGLAMIIGKLPDFINAGMQLLGALGQGILNNLPVIIDATVQIVNQIVTGIAKALPKVAQGAVQIITGLANGLAKMAPTLIPTIVQVVIDIVKTLIDNAPMMITAAITLIQGLADGIIASIPVIINALPTIITSVISALTRSIPRLIRGTIQLVMGIVSALPTIIQSLIDALPQIIEAVIQGLVTCLPALIQGHVMLILALVQALPQIMQALYDALPTIIQTVVSTLIANLPLLINGLIQLIAGIAQALPRIAMAIINVIPNIIKMAVNAILSVAGMILNAVISILTSIGSKLVEYGKTFVKDTNTAMKDLFNKVVEWLSQLPGKMAYYAGYAIGSFMKFVLELPGKVQEVFNNVINKLVAFATNFINKAKETAKNFLDSIVNGIKELPNNVKTTLDNVITNVTNFATDFITKAEKAAKDFLDKIVNGIKELPNNVKTTLDNVITNVVSFATDFLRKAQDAARDFLKGINDGIGGLPGDVEGKLNEVITKASTFVSDLGSKATDAASGFVTNLKNGVASLPEDFKTIGSNIVSGIWNGISGGWDWLKEQVSNLAQSLFNAAKKKLGIKSPSKKFAWIGQMVDEGFAKGLNDYSYLVDGALDDIINMPSVDDMVGNVSLNASGNAGNNGYTQILNITSPTALSPYEVARQARNATRDMVLAMSV